MDGPVLPGVDDFEYTPFERSHEDPDKRALTRALNNFSHLAWLDARWGRLDAHDAQFFRAVVGAAVGTLYQVFVETAHTEMEWGLRTYVAKIGMGELTKLVYWFTLYYIARLGDYGLDESGHRGPLLALAARKWIGYVSRGADVQEPTPWLQDWSTADAVSSAIELYDQTVLLLGLRLNHSLGDQCGRAFADSAVPDVCAVILERVHGAGGY